MLLFTIALALFAMGCSTPGQYSLANFAPNPSTCAQMGSMAGLALASVNAGVIGTTIGAAACSGFAALVTPKNQMTGTIEAPVQMAGVKLTAVPETFVCPANMSCVAKH